jgi:transposase
VITSVVATAHHAGVNAFDYLVALQRHVEAVKRPPERWLPWNYREAAEAQKKAA